MLSKLLLVPLVAGLATPQVRSVEATLETDIGSGSGEVVLGRVPDLAADGSGNVYVLDSQSGRVHVFSSAGEHLRSFGRRGGGPDELNRPIGIDVHESVVTVLNPSGHSSSYTLEGEPVATQQMPFGTQSVTRVAADAYALLSWGGISRQDPVPIESLIILDHLTPDTVLTAPSSDVLFRSPTANAALPTSLCGPVHFVVGAGRQLWVASGIDGTLTGWEPAGGPSSPSRSAVVAPEASPLPDSTRSRLLEALPRQLDPQAGDLYVPSLLSSICGLERSTEGLVWIRLADAPDGERWIAIELDTLSPTRELMAAPGVAISAFSGDLAFGIRADESGFPHVMVYRLR
jgi:hypothetical protein